MFMESWILRVYCKVNMKPFGLHLLCTRPKIFMIPWTFQKLNSFLKLLHLWHNLLSIGIGVVYATFPIQLALCVMIYIWVTFFSQILIFSRVEPTLSNTDKVSCSSTEHSDSGDVWTGKLFLKSSIYLCQGTKIFQYCTCPAGRVTYNFHLSCKHVHLSFKSICNKEHKGVIFNLTSSSNSRVILS